tara:strand:+ start:1896 stop:2159 length:264 start_codon:yes stop_codon:yes gene_type:complete
MKYDEWYNKGVELGYLRKYTTSMVATLASNIQMLEKAFTQSVQDQLGKSQTEMMEKYGNQLYWLMIQRDMMDNDDYWNESKKDKPNV